MVRLTTPCTSGAGTGGGAAKVGGAGGGAAVAAARGAAAAALASKAKALLRFELTISSMVAAMAPLQKASSGRIEKGSSIWMPISSMPSRKKAMKSEAGTVAQWFHEVPSTGYSPKGSTMTKAVRKRDVWRVYTSGTGDLKMRSHAPVRSTSVEMVVSTRARSIESICASRRLADIALRQNIGRLDAAMHASTCSGDISPAAAISSSSPRSVSSLVGPRRKLRSALAKAAVLAAIRSLISWFSGKYRLAWRTTLRQLLITPPHRVRASFQRA